MALVTLTTDFGESDGYAGAMKGVILSRAPTATIVDITHHVPRHDIAAGAYAIHQAAPYFPPATIHVVVVDPGVGGARQSVIVDTGRERLVGPDNGVLKLAAARPVAVYGIDNPAFTNHPVSSTFHGRDVFAAAAGALASGALPQEAGSPVSLLGQLPWPSASMDSTGVHGTVVHIDVFGNLVTNIRGDGLRAAVTVSIAGKEIGSLSQIYEDVERGELVAYVGSDGTLEIAVREGNAAQVLAVERGTQVRVQYRGDAGGRR